MQDVWMGYVWEQMLIVKRQLKTIVPLYFRLYGYSFPVCLCVVPPTEESKLRFVGYSDESLKLIIGFSVVRCIYYGIALLADGGQFG